VRAMDEGPPLFARVLVACCIAGRSYTPPTLWAHLRACREAGRAEAGDAIGGLRNRPRSVPSGLPLRVGTPSRLRALVISAMVSSPTVYIL
jgi:hypothetical protein